MTPQENAATLALHAACQSVDVAMLACIAAGWDGEAVRSALMAAHADLRHACAVVEIAAPDVQSEWFE